MAKMRFKEEISRIVGACFEYRKAARYRLALLVNFGHYPKLQYERIVH